MPYVRKTANGSKRQRIMRRNRGIYRTGNGYLRKPRFLLSQGGVPSARNAALGAMSYPPEVKYLDVTTSLIRTTDWQYLTTATCSAIGQGTGPTQRIGRQIRLVGVSYRFSMGSENDAASYCMDFIIDKQPSGASTAPPIANTGISSTNAIYATADNTSLPNVLGTDRFQFMKRVERKSPNSRFTTESGLIKMNKLVTYDGSTLAISDLVSNNLLVTFSAVEAVSVAGVVRLLYVDA